MPTLWRRSVGLIAVEDSVDMTTPQGRAFATMLAVFGEMEAAAISARVRSAHRALVTVGRSAGGRLPFGWRNVPNAHGPGVVPAKDPERIGIVEELAHRALAGESLYSLTRWLEENNILPRPRKGREAQDRWREASVEAILRNPVLAGMTSFTPGRKDGANTTRLDVLRDRNGLPMVDPSVAILTTDEYRRLVAVLDARRCPRGLWAYSTSGLLSGPI